MPRSLFAPFLLVLATGCIFQPGEPVKVGADVSYNSKYMFRGMVMNERGVAQGNLDADFLTKDNGSIQINAFGNLDLHDSTGDAWMPNGHDGHITESRGSVAYQNLFGPVLATGGLRTYVPANGNEFPFGARSATTEIFATVSGDVATIQPRFELHKDVDEADGTYLRAGAQRPFALADRLTLLVDSSLGWHDAKQGAWDYGLKESGFTDLVLQAITSYQLDEVTQTFVGLHASTVIDQDYQDWMDDVLDIAPTNFWVSAGFRWRF